MSRLWRSPTQGRAATLAAILVTSMPVTLGCGRTCTDIGCLEGLTVYLLGDPEPTKPYQVNIDLLTPTPEQVQIMTCSFSTSPDQGDRLSCSSGRPHLELGRTIRFPVWYRELRKVRITVSTGDRIVSDQVFEPAYETEEINGEGCGTCTGAAVSVNLS